MARPHPCAALLVLALAGCERDTAAEGMVTIDDPVVGRYAIDR